MPAAGWALAPAPGLVRIVRYEYEYVAPPGLPWVGDGWLKSTGSYRGPSTGPIG